MPKNAAILASNHEDDLVVNLEHSSHILYHLCAPSQTQEAPRLLDLLLLTRLPIRRTPRQGTIGGLFKLTCSHIKTILSSFETKSNEQKECKQDQRTKSQGKGGKEIKMNPINTYCSWKNNSIDQWKRRQNKVQPNMVSCCMKAINKCFHNNFRVGFQAHLLRYENWLKNHIYGTKNYKKLKDGKNAMCWPSSS